MRKCLAVEIIICFMDCTWNTDYVFLSWPTQKETTEQTHARAIAQFEKEEELKAEQRGSIGPSLAFTGIYNVNWDEPVDESGEYWDDDEDDNISQCYQCKKPVSFERHTKSLPQEYEVCCECDDHVCSDCVDWIYMNKIDSETPICKRCTAELKPPE